MGMGTFGIFSREKKETLDQGLAKTKESVFKKLSRAVVGKSKVDDEVLDNLEEGQLFIHYNGTYHSNDFEGIVWYLNHYRPGLKILTIASVEQVSTDKLEEDNSGLADFILVMPETMTKTY